MTIALTQKQAPADHPRSLTASHAPPAEPYGEERHASHSSSADFDAYALALQCLLSAVDRHARGPLHNDLARAVHDARELLTEDGWIPGARREAAVSPS